MKPWDKYIRGCVRLETPPEEIKRQYQLQKEHGDWTLYSERAFIEQLFSTRFNYFVATFSLLAAAVTRIEAPCLQLIALLVSAIILTLMGLAIYRVYVKLIIILKMLYQLEDYQDDRPGSEVAEQQGLNAREPNHRGYRTAAGHAFFLVLFHIRPLFHGHRLIAPAKTPLPDFSEAGFFFHSRSTCGKACRNLPRRKPGRTSGYKYFFRSNSARKGMPSAARLRMISNGLRMPAVSGLPGSTT